MTAQRKCDPLRDMELSTFGRIMQSFAERFDQIEFAIFFDSLGETIDYLSYRDPFIARLAAAHHGLIYESVATRLAWLKMGKIATLEISASELDSLTVKVEEDAYLTVMGAHGSIDDALVKAVVELAEQLKNEAGY